MNRQHANAARRRRLLAPAAPRATGARTPSLWQEVTTGAAVGLGACLVFAWALGGGAQITLAAALLGVGAGAVIGILFWVGVAPLPDDPVLPPGPGQERDPTRRRGR